uniref:uncharacterized protein LOC120817918 n=1 Tax=Gasterosteus aculeatus aculeatus TaxID=481459 RepID=UPI001A99BF56|nr:uncharacterized protein LOC120817918 [Gasterosteus aculeatus aculeatus]
MVSLKEELFKALQDLKEEEFEEFKWWMKEDVVMEGFPGIPMEKVEKAKRTAMVDLMVQKYRGPGARKITAKILEKVGRNDLVQRFQNTSNDVAQEQKAERKNPELKWVQQFAVDVTLDPDTVHPHLVLSADRKRVHHSDVRKTLPDNPKRFTKCVNVLGKQGFSSKRFYFEVQVKRKTAWALGVAKESINRKVRVKADPENGYWTLMMTDGEEYRVNGNDPIHLSLSCPLQKVGVFVDHEEGVVSFYDVEAAVHLYSFTGCSFSEKLYPFFTPFTNDGGKNSVPLIISPVNQHLKTHFAADQTEDYEKKKAELMSVQQFAVEVTLDPDTAHPNLILSGDGKQVYHGDLRKILPDTPERFFRCVNVLGEPGFSSGKFYFEVQVEHKTDWTVGVARESIERQGGITLGPGFGFWTICLDDEEYEAVDSPLVRLSLDHPVQKVGVFVDYEEGVVSFYNVDSADHLYSFTGCSFTEKVYPFFSPCKNGGGRNSAPLIISPVKKQVFGGQKEYEKRKAELQRVRQFAVEVTLDPDTAHPALILWDDKKQVSCGDVYKNLPDNDKRFKKCVNILGKESFSSGRFYFEVQVKGKTAWTVGVAKESINRAKSVTLSTRNGYWTLWLKNANEYEANDSPTVGLSLSRGLQKVGVFVDYEEGLVSFYDVHGAIHLYSFTGCSFTENLYPFFSPSTNDEGLNSAPLTISPVRPSSQTEDYEKKKAELMSVQQFAVEVTLDPDTAHPSLILSGDGKQVYHGDVRKILPDTPERFYKCINVLGEPGFSSGKSYFEVQVKHKTEWTVGVARESIERKGKITLGPGYGIWTICLDDEEYEAVDSPLVRLSLDHPLQKVGVFVDYEEGLVSFYNVDSADHLYSFTGCSFTEKLYPFFCPSTNDDGLNSAPLTISPVRPSGQKDAEKKAELMSVQEFAVEVTLDPDTAHPSLILSGDGKQVYHGDVRKILPDNPARF